MNYRWRVTGNDGYISVSIWPINKIGPSIHGNFDYHQTWLAKGDGSFRSAKDQIVVTSRLIRRVIEHAIDQHDYKPEVKGKQLHLRVLDDLIKWEDAVRASNKDAR